MQRDGIYNQNLQAVPPTGSISYINHSDQLDPSRRGQDRDPQRGQIGRVYIRRHTTNDNLEYYQGRVRDRLREDHRHLRRRHAARRPGPEPDPVLPATASTRDVNKAADLRLAARESRRSTTSACVRWRWRVRRWTAASAACQTWGITFDHESPASAEETDDRKTP